MDNRTSVTVRYSDSGKGICIIVFKRGVSRTFKYSARCFDRLLPVIASDGWDLDNSDQRELYFYRLG